MTFVKICGLTKAEDAWAAAEAGADALGFVHFVKSPRHLDERDAVALGRDLPPNIRRVGVMVDPDLDTVARFAESLKLDTIQFHGHETPLMAGRVKAELGLRVIKAIPVANKTDLDGVKRYDPVVDALLFDAKPPPGADLPGGNALSFPWALMQALRTPLPWLLAGGLTPDTVAEAIRVSGATGVDVSSGVESEPGIKSRQRIDAFLRAAKSAKA